MTPMNDESQPPIATGLPTDEEFLNHPDAEIFEALGCDLRGYEPACDGSDVEECDFRCSDCERNCDLEG